MKVLVTGGAGYIGSCAAKHLLDAGHQVDVFDSMELGHVEALDRRARLIVGDLRREGEIMEAMRASKPDAVMHFAAYALVGESSANPGKSSAGAPSLTALLGEDCREKFDDFDLVQFARVVEVCRESSSAADAARQLFAVSMKAKSSSNNSDRLVKYLARFGLKFKDL